ncbi:MAG: hypothetical protein SFU25_11435 [Candidatus Caenarcaniphilales bacterium]|nr:hypothetical protein [Candidatus Caenarcaniphilales bacterium]
MKRDSDPIKQKSLSFLLFKLRLWILFHVFFPLRVRISAFFSSLKNFNPRSFTHRTWWFIQSQKILGFLEKIESTAIRVLNSSFLSVAFVSLLLIVGIGLILFRFFPNRLPALTFQGFGFNASVKANSSKVNDLLLKATTKSGLSEKTRKEILFKAFSLNPASEQTNKQMALHFLQIGDLKQAQKNIDFLTFLNPQDVSTIALNGALNLRLGNYQQADKQLGEAYKKGYQPEWVLESYAIALIANNKTEMAAQLAGWPADCQTNSLSHADCMNKIASWHEKIIEIEKQVQKCELPRSEGSKNLEKQNTKVDSNVPDKSLYHRKRQIIFLGESLRTFFQAIQETDGVYRLFLIQQYEKEKQKLLLAHSAFMTEAYLNKNNTSAFELTLQERKLKI